jgi:hypothetical protein
MKKMMQSVVATALCAVSLCAVTAPREAHAAAGAKALYSGQFQEPTNLFVWVDGTRKVDGRKLTQQARETYAGTEWVVMNSRTIVIRKDGEAIGTPLPFGASNEEKDYIVVHGKAKDGSSVDGKFFRFLDDPARGWTEMFFTVPVQGGGSYTIFVEGPLEFSDEPSE